MKLLWLKKKKKVFPNFTTSLCFLRENYLCESVEERKQFHMLCTLLISLWGASLEFNSVCAHARARALASFTSGSCRKSPTQRVMNVGPSRQPLRVSHYGSVLSQPSLPVSPHSMVDPTECTKLALLWLIELPACPPTSTQPHKAVPHHQMWWSLVLILVWGLNGSADTVWNTNLTVKLELLWHGDERKMRWVWLQFFLRIPVNDLYDFSKYRKWY